jgi:hypothetical protein
MPPEGPPSDFDISEDIIELLESLKETFPPDERYLDAGDFDYPPPEDFHSSLGDADSLPDPNPDFVPNGYSPPVTPSDQEHALPPHLIVNFTKEYWQKAEIYGLVFRKDEETIFTPILANCQTEVSIST